MIEPATFLKVADLGCGTGELTSLLHKKLKAKYTLGIDSSAEMLKKAIDFKSESLVFSLGDINKWQSEEKFHLIFSNAALQWCSNHENIFKNLKKSLADDGQVAIQMPFNQDYITHKLAIEMSNDLPWKNLLDKPYEKEFMLSPEHYANLLFSLGFKKQQIQIKVYGHVLESREEVIEWVKGTLLNYFKSRLPSPDYDNFVKEYRERLFQKLPDTKPFFYPFKRIFIWGRL